jgi:gliding motility-associated-like protein
VSIKVTDNHYDQYLIDFNDDNNPEAIIPFSNNAVARYNYGTTTPQVIRVRGRDLNSADNCSVESQNFTPLATLPAPAITTLTALDPTSLRLNLNTQNDIQYRLEIGVNSSSAFQLFQTLYETNTVTVPNLLLDNNFYCFRLSAFDPCTNTNNYSNVICSADVDIALASGVNTFSWRTSSAGVVNQTISRRGSDNTNFSTTRPFQSSYVDADVDCNVNYCYTLTNNYPNGARSISLTKCGTAFNNTAPPAIANVSATVGDGVALTWSTNPLIKIKVFEISRGTNGTLLDFAETPTPSPFADATYTTEGNYCYQINYRDLCENRSLQGVTVCPIRLLGTMDDNNVVTLQWTRFRGWANGVRLYTVEKFNQSGTRIRTFNMGLDTTLVDDQPDLTNQVVSYRVTATANQAGLTASVSNTVSFTKEINLTFPTAFTPNRDRLNDLFTVTGQYVSKMNIRIFDRWGVLIYASEKNEPWDGTRNGIPMPESTYVWKAEITDLAGRTYAREGTLVLLRK